MRHTILPVSLYSFAHALVDLSCAWIIFSKISDITNAVLLLLLYNFLAFALQMPFGLLCTVIPCRTASDSDKFICKALDDCNQDHATIHDAIIAVIGCLFVLAAFLPRIPALTCILLLGLGNALFHVGAGTDLLYRTSGHASSVGIFVSTGALGLWVGTKLANVTLLHADTKNIVHIILAVILLITTLLLSVFLRARPVILPTYTDSPADLLVVISLFLVTALRSLLGLSVVFTFRSTLFLSFLLILAVVTGKMLGGILYDRIGHTATILLSLLSSSALFLFPGSVICAFGSLLFFNMTMPVTLCMMAQQFKNAMGFAFGLLTFALFLGYLPVVLKLNIPLSSPVSYSIVCLISLLLLLIANRRVVKLHDC